MNKRELIQKLQEQLTKDLLVLRQSAMAAYESATHSESKAEDQYDTRGLEASYLAGAQARRVEELESLSTLFQFIDLKEFSENSPISATALVELECDGKSSYYFLMPKGGGMSIVFDSKIVQLITPQSPLGGALLGHKVGDCVDIDIRGGLREYRVLTIK